MLDEVLGMHVVAAEIDSDTLTNLLRNEEAIVNLGPGLYQIIDTASGPAVQLRTNGNDQITIRKVSGDF